ncbi:hypothetical protein P4H66_19555 [Paenibacillus dokdonensis]|uniref:Uncharacterized protein n=1 Tax=Paenibacillus dokdonensis TaxID=2567944 RepID=A0ABU6GS00_9BACL|nr:hypothetical protein [Paenibacillus dokdonensis]MEC0242003.1 hypothetical protein [Paenibacillus dokdonensis]
MDKLQADKLTEIRKAYNERLEVAIERNPQFRVDAVTVQRDVQYLLQLVETKTQRAETAIKANVLLAQGNADLISKNHLLHAQVETQAKALEFYADEETYEQQWVDDAEQWADPEIECDQGQRAREALTQV